MSTTAPDAPPSISLAGGKNNWDDRELVNAYDAALLEFHIHNPGPGSWLDKATAALAKGQPLPGAADFGTTWYSSSKEKESATAVTSASTSKTTQAKGKEKAAAEPARKKAKTTTTATASVNPYSMRPAVAARASSPTYTPVSPGGEPEGQWDEVAWPPADESSEEQDGEEGEEGGWQGYDGYGQEEEQEDGGQVFPPPSGQWPGVGLVGRDEAIGYALHAQYWAGYWMGVAHGTASSGRPRGPGGTKGMASRGGNGAPNGIKR